MGTKIARVGRIVSRRMRPPLTRSEIMSRIRSKDTQPEIRARSAVYALGQRFRIHVSGLPGKPDLSNKTRRWAIFVHGCFWHSHKGCRLASKPRSNHSYWSEKLARNQSRDEDHERGLRDLGFDVLILWECDTRNAVKLQQILAAFFRSSKGYSMHISRKANFTSTR